MTDKNLDTPSKTINHKAETPTNPRCINWDAPNLIHTYNDEKGFCSLRPQHRHRYGVTIIRTRSQDGTN